MGANGDNIDTCGEMTNGLIPTYHQLITTASHLIETPKVHVNEPCSTKHSPVKTIKAKDHIVRDSDSNDLSGKISSCVGVDQSSCHEL